MNLEKLTLNFNDRLEDPTRADTLWFVFAVSCAVIARFGPQAVAFRQDLGWLMFVAGSVVSAALIGWSLLPQRRVQYALQRSLAAACAIAIAAALPLLAVRSLEGLAPRSTGFIESSASLVTDPEAKTLTPGVAAVVRIEGKRVRATFTGESAARIQDTSAGSRLLIRGKVSAWPEKVPSWAVSKHLVGNMTVSSVSVVSSGAVPWRVAGWIRSKMQVGAAVLPENQRPLFLGFVLGDDRGQRAEVTDDFRASGLSHLLVVSGQNVAFLLVAICPLLRRVGSIPRLVISIGVVLAFALLTRFEPSVLRASTMAMITVTVRTSGRPQPAIRTVALSVIVLLLIDPLLSWSIGFGLSVAATSGLALLSQPLERKLPGPRWLIRPLSATMAAQLGTFPFLLTFGGVHPLTIVANLLALPAAEPIMVWGVLTGLPAGLLGERAAWVLHLPVYVLLTWVNLVSRVAAELVRTFPTWNLWPLVASSCLVGSRLASSRIPHKRRLVCVGFIVTAIPLIVQPAIFSAPLDAKELGRSGLTVWRSGTQIIGHTDRLDAASALQELRREGVTHLDVLVVANPTRNAWTRHVALFSRTKVGVIVTIGPNSSLENLRVIGLGRSDVARIPYGKGELIVACPKGKCLVSSASAKPG